MLIDTHCHLTWPDFDTDREAVIARARQAGVTRLITIGAGQGVEGNAKAVALAERHEAIYAAVGLHPHDAKLFTAHALAELEALATHPKVVAIGEIGLDYHYDFASHAEQHAAFRAQLDLARRLDLPILLHQREAEEDLLAILDSVTLAQEIASAPAGPRNDRPIRGIQHCFGGSLAYAQEMMRRGFVLGIGGVVTFKKSESLRAVVKALPLAHLVLETDAPYLAPVPYRGKRNEPAYLIETAKVVAAIQGIAIEEVLRITTDTARRLLTV